MSRSAKFPNHSEPRVWLVTSAACPVGIALTRQLLAHGDSVILGTKSEEISDPNKENGQGFMSFWVEEVLLKDGWKDRARVVALDGRCEVPNAIHQASVAGSNTICDTCRLMGQCQAAVAEAISVFGGLDVLFCCASEGIHR